MNNYCIGTVLKVDYLTYYHYGIYIGNNLVIHNSKAAGKVERIDLTSFIDGKKVEVSKKIQSKNQNLAVQIAQALLHQPYNLFLENCEHFVRVCCGLFKESIQVQKYLVAGSTLVTAYLSKNKNIRITSIATTLMVLFIPVEKDSTKRFMLAILATVMILFLFSKKSSS